MKKLQIFGLGGAAAVIVAGVVYGVFTLSTQALTTPTTKKEPKPQCTEAHTEHTVTISYGKLNSSDIHAQVCDKLTIVNTDGQLRLMAFGVHDSHQAYDGVREKTLQKDQRMTITLTKRGTFTFHDHLQKDLIGTFTVQ